MLTEVGSGELRVDSDLVECLSRTDPQHHTVRIEQAEGAKSLREDGGKSRREHACAQDHALSAFAYSGQPGQGERRTTAYVTPRLIVVADQTESKPTFSARTANSTNSRGTNCSSEAF